MVIQFYIIMKWDTQLFSGTTLAVVAMGHKSFTGLMAAEKCIAPLTKTFSNDVDDARARENTRLYYILYYSITTRHLNLFARGNHYAKNRK